MGPTHLGIKPASWVCVLTGNRTWNRDNTLTNWATFPGLFWLLCLLFQLPFIIMFQNEVRDLCCVWANVFVCETEKCRREGRFSATQLFLNTCVSNTIDKAISPQHDPVYVPLPLLGGTTFSIVSWPLHVEVFKKREREHGRSSFKMLAPFTLFHYLCFLSWFGSAFYNMKVLWDHPVQPPSSNGANQTVIAHVKRAVTNSRYHAQWFMSIIWLIP